MREIKGTLIVVSACCLWHISTAFILNSTGLFFLGMPAWFSVSVFGTIVIALVGVRVLLKKVFIDFEYDAESDEGEAGVEGTKGVEIAESDEDEAVVEGTKGVEIAESDEGVVVVEGTEGVGTKVGDSMNVIKADAEAGIEGTKVGDAMNVIKADADTAESEVSHE